MTAAATAQRPAAADITTAATVAAALATLAFGADYIDGGAGYVMVSLTSSGFAWGLAALLVGHHARSARRAATAATTTLIIATAGYYLLILFVSRRWSGGTLVDGTSGDLYGLRSVAIMAGFWLAGSAVAGPLLGLLGHAIRSQPRTAARTAAPAGHPAPGGHGPALNGQPAPSSHGPTLNGHPIADGHGPALIGHPIRNDRRSVSAAQPTGNDCGPALAGQPTSSDRGPAAEQPELDDNGPAAEQRKHDVSGSAAERPKLGGSGSAAERLEHGVRGPADGQATRDDSGPACDGQRRGRDGSGSVRERSTAEGRGAARGGKLAAVAAGVACGLLSGEGWHHVVSGPQWVLPLAGGDFNGVALSYALRIWLPVVVLVWMAFARRLWRQWPLLLIASIASAALTAQVWRLLQVVGSHL
ncbi:hypothetical protein ACQPZJ_25740 [Actinoplanes sp. CA-054009]